MALHKHKRGIPGGGGSSHKGSKHQSGHKDEKVGQVLGEFKRGTLRSSTGARVTQRDQAVAIALRQAGVPPRPEDRSSHNTHGVTDLVEPLPELNQMAGHDHDVDRLMRGLRRGT